MMKIVLFQKGKAPANSSKKNLKILIIWKLYLKRKQKKGQK